MLFRDRAEAGRFLALKLAAHTGRQDTVILALPRGGVPVAFEVAKSLDAPLDVFIVRKLGCSGTGRAGFGRDGDGKSSCSQSRHHHGIRHLGRSY